MPLLPLLSFFDVRAVSQFEAYWISSQAADVDATESRLVNEPGHASSSEATARGTKKRPIALESADSGPRKKIDNRSEHEKRLTGDYTAPTDAQPIGTPRHTDGDSELHKSANSMAVKFGTRRGHKPIDTLNQPSPHATNAQNQGHRSTAQHITNWQRLATPARKPHSVQSPPNPIIVPPARDLIGDGFDRGERDVHSRPKERPSKKRKLEMAPPEPHPLSDPIDLTDDGEVIALNGKPLPSIRRGNQNGSFVSEPAPPHFENTAYHRVNEKIEIGRFKPRRRSRDSLGSSQASSREIPADGINVRPKITAQTSNQSVVHITDDEPPRRQPQAHAGRNQKEYQQRPQIDLGVGVDRPQVQKASISTEQDIQNSNDVLRSAAVRRTRKEPSSAPKNAEASIRRPRHISQDSKDEYTPYVRQRDKDRSTSPKLRQKFVRDDEHPTQRASQRMKAVSHNGPFRDDLSSADELAGGVTVSSQPSQSASPQKQSHGHHRLPKNGRDGNRQRSGSPTELQWTQTRRNSLAKGTIKSVRQQANILRDDEELEDLNTVPVQAFYATSCVLTSGDIKLQYDASSKEIDLRYNGELVVVPGKKSVVSITETETRRVWYGEPSGRVYMKGSAGNVSNGLICIAFHDWKAVAWFLERIRLISDNQLQWNSVDTIHLDKMFLKQSTEIEKAAQKAKSHRNDLELALLAKRQPRIAHSLQYGNDDEQIRYETDEPERLNDNSTRPSRLSKEARMLQPSPYFANGSSDLRRSSRQPKPIAHREPSPPPVVRWTHEHRPPPWSHSVVYPPTGTRRVTVDFQDLERLDEGEFLNDNIISFALRRVEDSMAPEHRENVYFFNSFFYTALTTKNGRRGFNYDAVKRWTKNTDLLNFPYVVIPVNIDFHWFVAIICNLPSIERRAAGLDESNETQEQVNGIPTDEPSVSHDQAISSLPDHLDSELVRPQDDGVNSDVSDGENSSNARSPEVTAEQSSTLSRINAQTEAMRHLSLSPEDQKPSLESREGNSKALIGNQTDTLERADRPIGGRPSVAAKKAKKRAAPGLKKYDPDEPVIITLDSFGSGHAVETRSLKDYLRMEAEEKRGIELDIQQLSGMTAKGIPEQTNFCDCGVYLVGYVEQFAKDPRKFVTKVLTRQLDKQADFANFDASAKRAEIRNELLQLHEDQSAERRETKAAKKETRAGNKSPGTVPATAQPVQQTPNLLNEQTDEVDPLKDGANQSRQEAGSRLRHKPVDSTQGARVETQRIASDNGRQDDDLEISVPRPLENASNTFTRETPTPPAADGDMHNDDEMLDSAREDRSHTHQHDEEIADDASSSSILDPLADILSKGPTFLQGNARSAQVDEDEQSHDVQSPSNHTVQHSSRTSSRNGQEVIDLDEGGPEAAEIPDSQELPFGRHPSWSGKYQKFPD